MDINPHLIPPLLCSIYALCLGIIVLTKNPKSGVHQSFFLLCISTVVWLSFYSINFTLSYSHLNHPFINKILRIGYCGVTFIAVAFFHHTIEFLGIKWAKAWNIGNYIYGLIISLLILQTDLIVNGIKEFFWGLYPQAGPLHPYFLTYFLALLSVSFSLFLKRFFSADIGHAKRNQLKYLFLALFIFSFASFDFIPNYGIGWYPWGYVPTIFFLTIVTYAIIKHHLMDINIVLKTSVLYSLLIASVSIAYLAIVLTTEKALQSLLGYNSMSISLSAAFIIGIIVIPLRNRIQFLLDRSLFKGTQPEIAAENELLRKEVAQSEKHKAVAAMASGIAHEVRNPLTALKTFYEHFPEKKDDPEFVAKFTRIAGKEIGRIEGLLQQLLDFAKPSPPSFQETDINRLIEETLDLLVNKLQTQNITLRKHLEGQGARDKEQETTTFHLPTITLQVDSNQIKQALLNIFLNAVDAMPDGGQLTVASFAHRPSSYIVTIADTGKGIAQEDLPRIFEPFFSKKASGTGLGLAITQEIIKEHGGKIKVNSAVNEGTTFTIELLIKK